MVQVAGAESVALGSKNPNLIPGSGITFWLNQENVFSA
jgi:hypothetical protein